MAKYKNGNAKPMPSQERLKFLFKYRDDGNLIWKNPLSNRCEAGDIVGYLEKDGYRRVWIDGEKHYFHRLIYQFHNGELSSGFVVDHIDNNKSNNRIENLRVSTPKGNSQKRKQQSNNTSGLSWVSWNKNAKKWQADYTDENGKSKNLGYFTNKYHAYHIAAEATSRIKGSNHKEQLSVEDRHAYMDWLIEETDRQNQTIFKLAA